MRQPPDRVSTRGRPQAGRVLSARNLFVRENELDLSIVEADGRAFVDGKKSAR